MSPRRAHLPGRQPAHQAAAVLGVADRRGHGAPTPTCVFLAEAFTRPAMMHALGGGRLPPVLHLLHLAQRARTRSTSTSRSWRARPTTRCGRTSSSTPPTSCTRSCSTAARPAFKIRAALAATGSPSWGVYAGFELFEHVAVRPGSEEYLDTEKYQFRVRDWAAAEAGGRHARAVPHRLNEIRRAHPALQRLRNVTIHATDDHAILVVSARAPPTAATPCSSCVNLDPHGTRETTVHLDMPALGLDWHDAFAVHDEITGATWTWGEHNFVRLEPPAASPPTSSASGSPHDRGRQPKGPHRPTGPPRAGWSSAPTGTGPQSSTRCWCARSATPTVTAPATSRG